MNRLANLVGVGAAAWEHVSSLARCWGTDDGRGDPG